MYQSALFRAQRERALQAVLAPLAERDEDDAARRVGVVVRAGRGDDLDPLDFLGAQRSEVGHELRGFHAQLAVVHEHLRAALTVDRDFLAVHPYAGSAFEQLRAVAPCRRRRIGHVHHEAVGLAPDDPGLHHDPFDLRGRAAQYEVPQVALRRHMHLPRQRVVAQVLNPERVVSRRGFQREAPLGVGGCSRHLRRIPEQDDRGVFHGSAPFVHYASFRGA